MNKDTYEALKRIINQRGYHYFSVESGKKDYKAIMDWIEEVAKEYDWEENRKCTDIGVRL